MEIEAQPDTAATSWHITRRWQEYEGEIRVAILRVALVAIFYGVQLLNYFVFSERAEADLLFHRQITAVSAGWLFVSLAVLVALRQRYFPPLLKFATVAFDLMLLTASAAMGSGPHSPLVGCFYLIIAMSALRFSLPLIWMATLGSIAGYLVLVGMADSTWFDSQHATAPVQQLVTLGALLGTGLAMGQLVRMIRRAAEEYFQRHQRLEGVDSPT